MPSTTPWKSGSVSISRPKSPSTVLKALASSQINRLRVKSTDQTRLTITEPTPNQRAYVSALQCDAILEDRPMQSVVTAMKSWL